MRIGHAHLGRGSHADADQRVRIKPTVAVHRAHTNRRARHAALAGRKHRHPRCPAPRGWASPLARSEPRPPPEASPRDRAAALRRASARSPPVAPRGERPTPSQFREALAAVPGASRCASGADPAPAPAEPCGFDVAAAWPPRALGARAALRRRKQHGRGRAAQRQLQLGHDGVPGAHARRQRRLPTMLAGRAQAPRGLDRRRVSRRPACAAMAPSRRAAAR